MLMETEDILRKLSGSSCQSSHTLLFIFIVNIIEFAALKYVLLKYSLELRALGNSYCYLFMYCA